MIRIARWIGALAFAAMMLLPARPAAALCLLCSCTASASGVAFGNYDPTSATALTSSGNVQVSCAVISGVVALGVSYTIALSAGLSTNYAPRQMGLVGATATRLGYNLFTSGGLVWGDGTGSSLVSDSYLVALGAATVKNYPIAGTIPAKENVKIGTYNDTIMVTVTY